MARKISTSDMAKIRKDHQSNMVKSKTTKSTNKPAEMMGANDMIMVHGGKSNGNSKGKSATTAGKSNGKGSPKSSKSDSVKRRK